MEKYKALVARYLPAFGIYEGKEMAKKERINELILEIEFPADAKNLHANATQLMIIRKQIEDITTVLKLMAKDKYDVD
jgi:hypothetical protein